jgi:hypothetical protein
LAERIEDASLLTGTLDTIQRLLHHATDLLGVVRADSILNLFDCV